MLPRFPLPQPGLPQKVRQVLADLLSRTPPSFPRFFSFGEDFDLRHILSSKCEQILCQKGELVRCQGWPALSGEPEKSSPAKTRSQVVDKGWRWRMMIIPEQIKSC